MSPLTLVWKNLHANATRSVLTMLSSAVMLFLFTAWLTVMQTLKAKFEETSHHARVAIRHRASFSIPLPAAYFEKIKAVPGVEAVTPHIFYGGLGPKESVQFPTLAADPEEWPKVWNDYAPSAEVSKAWQAERTGCLIGEDLERQFGWKPGMRISLRGTIFPGTLEFKVIGVLKNFLNPQLFLFHRKYFEEATKFEGVTMYWARVGSVDDIPRVARAVDEMFANSAAETVTESERDMFASFVGTQGQVIKMVQSVGPLVLVIMLMVCANTMSMAVRERTSQFAVLKCLGFTATFVLGMVIGEGALLALVGGTAGALFTWALVQFMPIAVGFGPLAGLKVQGLHVASGVALAVVVGMVASGVPAWIASRMSPAAALRQVR